MRRTVCLIAALLGLAHPAGAAPDFLIGFEGGFESGSPGVTSPPWTSVTGSPTVEAHAGLTGLDSGNTYSLRVDPAGGASEYVVRALPSAASEVSAHFELCLRATPAAGTKRRILEYHSATGTQCFAQLESDRRVRLYFRDDGGECAGSLNNGTNCTDTSNCRDINPGAKSCAVAQFAQSPPLAVGQCYELMVFNDTSLPDPGNVQCGLYVDGALKGAGIRAQGACSGGLYPGDACAKNADCSQTTDGDGLGTCSVTTLGTVTEVRLGVTDTRANALDLTVDNVAVRGGSIDSSLITFRLEDLHPDGTTLEGAVDGVGGASNNHTAVDDTTGGATGGNDGNTTNIQFQGTNKERWTLDELATLGAGEAVAAVALTCFVRETSDNSNTPKTIALGLYDGSTERNPGPAVEVQGYGTTFRQLPPFVYDTDATSSAWSESDVDSLQFVTEHTGTNSASHRVRFTDCWAETMVTKPLPPNPTALVDVTSDDNEITVGFIGSSRLADDALYSGLEAQLEQPANLYALGYEGRKLGHLYGTDGSCLQAVLNGGAGSCWRQLVKKGATGHALDYAFFCLGDNDYVAGPTLPIQGKCYMADTGHAQHGQPCAVPDGNHSYAGYDSYCVNAARFGATCSSAPTDCGACSGGSNPGAICTSGANCTGGGTCAGLAAQFPNCDASNTTCIPGRLDSPQCVGGVCSARSKTSAVHDWTYKAMLDKMAAQAESTGIVPIAVLPYRAQEKAGPNTATFQCRWTDIRSEFWARRAWLQGEVERRGWNYIDLDPELMRRCDLGRVDCCMRDGMHLAIADTGGSSATGISAPGFGICPDPSETVGVQILVDLVEDCLEGDANANMSCRASDAFERPTLGSTWTNASYDTASTNVAVHGGSDAGTDADGDKHTLAFWSGPWPLTGSSHYACGQATVASGNAKAGVCLAMEDGSTDDAVCCILGNSNQWQLDSWNAGVRTAAHASGSIGSWAQGDYLGIQRSPTGFRCYWAAAGSPLSWTALGGGDTAVSDMVSPGSGGVYFSIPTGVSLSAATLERWEMGAGALPTDHICGKRAPGTAQWG